MNILFFQLFCYAVEEKSISAAAKKAFLSQPAVTKKIRQLEDHYSTLLFERDHNTLTLTAAGKRLYHYAQNIVEEYKQSLEAIENLRGEEMQTLKIGSTYTLGEYVLPAIISAFQQKHPALHLKLSISNTPTVLESLGDRSIDLAFIEGDIQELNIDKKIIGKDDIVLIVAPNHKWAVQKHIVPRDLLNERMIRREDNSSTRQIIETHLSEKIELNQLENTLELSTTQAIKSAVQSGLGYGYVSRLSVHQELKVGLLSEVDVSGIRIQRPLWVARRSQRFPKESMEEFSVFCQRYLQKHSTI